MGIVGDMGAFAQFQAANSMEKAAENQNDGGIMGTGMGIGLGMGMMGHMGNVFQERKFEGNTPSQQSGAGSGPPPLPRQEQKSIFYVAQGQQQGPLALSEIQSLITSGAIGKETLIWYAGLAAWEKAGDNAEVASLFQNIPPPIPGV